MTGLLLLVFAAWAAAVFLFVRWRAGVLAGKCGDSGLLDDPATSLFVRGTALIVLVIVFLARCAAR